MQTEASQGLTCEEIVQAAYSAGMTLPIECVTAIPSTVALAPQDRIWLEPQAGHRISLLALAISDLSGGQTSIAVRPFEGTPHVCFLPGRSEDQPDLIPESGATPARSAAVASFENGHGILCASMQSLIRAHEKGVSLRGSTQDEGGLPDAVILAAQREARCSRDDARATRSIYQFASWYLASHVDSTELYRFLRQDLAESIEVLGEDLIKSIYVRHRDEVELNASVIGFTSNTVILRTDDRNYTVSVDPRDYSPREIAMKGGLQRFRLCRYGDVSRLGSGKERFDLAPKAESA